MTATGRFTLSIQAMENGWRWSLIEKIDIPRGFDDALASAQGLARKINRQDRVLAQLIHNGMGGMEQYLDPDDYAETMKAYREDKAGG